ncbi:DUF2513 domain-containing protein [Desulfococcaceae bacterium HSG9]|nr:DUF2513 domain-containing protein [Desulfococcaceae bacterium HSG9]
MKRDWDLVREILIRVEELSSVKDCVRPNEFEEYDEDIVSYHMYLLEQANLVEGPIKKHHNAGIMALLFNLTWQGHEFLDSVRNDGVWNKLKTTASEKGISMPFEVIKASAVAIIKGLLV